MTLDKYLEQVKVIWVGQAGASRATRKKAIAMPGGVWVTPSRDFRKLLFQTFTGTPVCHYLEPVLEC